MKRFLWVLVFFLISESLAWGQSNIIDPEKEAYSVLRKYEKSYTKCDLSKMIDSVDQSSDWFKRSFLDEFQDIFRVYTAVRLYHFGKDAVYISSNGVEITQNTLYLAYNTTMTDMKEYRETYTLRKIGDDYKIVNWAKEITKDMEAVEKGNGALIENDITEAVSQFKKSISYNSSNSAAHCRLGTIYAKQGKVKQAQEELQKAIELRPEASLYRFLLAQVYFMQNDMKNSLEAMSLALRQDPDLHVIGEEKKEK